MFKNTLISLAVIRSLANQQKNFLDFILPFVIEAVAEIDQPFIENNVVKYIENEFGLYIPERTIELTLKKLQKNGDINKNNHTYTNIKISPSESINEKAEEAKRIINCVIEDIQDFAKNKSQKRVNLSEEQVVNAVLSFLSNFSVECLKFFHRNSVLPQCDSKNWELVFVSAYVKEKKQIDPAGLARFMIMAYGQMLTTSLLCPDLSEATKTYKNVSFFFDTINIINALGLDGKPAQDAALLLFEQLTNLGGCVCCFSHTVDEIRHVISSAAQYIDKDYGVGGIVIESRKNNLEPADLILISQQVEDLIDNLKIQIIPSPGYIVKYQIDEAKFEAYLLRKLSYKNFNAKLIDIKSLRCIFALRKGNNSLSIEKSKAIFVTKNTKFASAASDYAFEIENSHITPIIDSFTLANIAWLKSPTKAPLLPAKEIIAFSYAALKPSKVFWERVISQAERLREQDAISVTQLQILRASATAQEIVLLETLGDESKIDQESICYAIETATNAIKSQVKTEMSAQLMDLEQKLNTLTRCVKDEKEQRLSKIKKLCERKSKNQGNIIYYIGLAILIFVVIGATLPENLLYFFSLMGFENATSQGSYLITFCKYANIIISSLIVITGFAYSSIKEWLYERLYQRLMRIESEKEGMDVSLTDGFPK